MNHPPECAVAIKISMVSRGLTQRTLQEMTGWDQGTISKKLNNRIGLTVADIYVLAEALDVPPRDLIPSGPEVDHCLRWAMKNKPKALEHDHD